MSFDQLGLRPELVRAVTEQGYTEPTPVQVEAIPLVLAGRDLLAGAQTGTGKTAAFVLPVLQRLREGRPTAPRRIRVLIVVPTRELAIQVDESVRVYGAHQAARSTAIYGGVGFDRQVRVLRSAPEIVVATPGRLLDHVGQRTIDLRSVEIVVLDEADRMLDMGFIHDVRKLLALLPPTRQSLLFSATFSAEIRELAAGMLRDPASVQATPRNTPPELVDQLVMPVDRERKRELLTHLVRSRRIDQALVFTRTKHGANRLAQQLDADGIAAAAIHGNKSQPQRVRALNDFKQGRVLVLVATDIAARGIDIDSLPHVVNYELPTVPEDYVHRIGRTGRAGIDGTAISLVCVDEHRLLVDIERLLRRSIAKEIVPGFEPDPRVRPEPIRLRSGMGAPHHGARAGARPARPQPEPFERRPDVRPQARFEPRPAYTEQPPRFELRPASTEQPRRAESRPAYRPQQPTFDARRGHHGPRALPNGAGHDGQRRDRPRNDPARSSAQPPGGGISNRAPASTDLRNGSRRTRSSDWRASSHPTGDRAPR